jgi:hypothetical protein
MNFSGNIKLGFILGLLILVSLALQFWDSKQNKTSWDTDLFVIDNIDQVDRVVITRGGEVMDCRAFSGGFMINNQFLMDENLLTVLAAVFQQVRVRRPLAGDFSEEIKDNIYNTGSQVKVYQGDIIRSSFWAGGDQQKKDSYFIDQEGNVYLVHLPGYTSYVSELFELPMEKWRSRQIFLNSWRSLISFSYQDFKQSDNDFQINYQDPFFSVSGIQRLDSNRIVNYLQDLVTLKASALVDTTIQDMPWLELSTTDIDPAKNQTLTLYGDQSQKVVLGKAGAQFFSFSKSSLEPLIQDAEYFRRK